MVGSNAEPIAAKEEPRDVDPDIEAIADAYVALAQGNVRLALCVSVADRMAAARLVSRGFARWGQPTPRRCYSRG